MAYFARGFSHRWLAPPQPVNDSYEGRNVIVTGASSGIGREAAAKFAELGASKVILAVRDVKKGEAAKSVIQMRIGQAHSLEVWDLDMSSYASITDFAKRANLLDRIDVVILNAGVHRKSYGRTQHGWEEDLQVNTLSSTLLAILLLPKLKTSRSSSHPIPVLEFVNSGSHQTAFVAQDVQREQNILEWYNDLQHFAPWPQYKFSKLFQMYAMSTLAREVSSGDVIITSICPGPVNSDIGRDYQYPIITSVLKFILGLLFFHTPKVGANAILSGTTQGERLHGRFWKYDSIMPVAPTLLGENQKLGLRIWEEIVQGLKKDVPNVQDALDAIPVTS